MIDNFFVFPFKIVIIRFRILLLCNQIGNWLDSFFFFWVGLGEFSNINGSLDKPLSSFTSGKSDFLRIVGF